MEDQLETGPSLRALVDANADAFAVLRAVPGDFRFVAANARLREQLGTGHLDGRLLSEIRPDDVDMCATVLATGESVTWRDIPGARHRDGGHRVLDFDAHRIDAEHVSIRFVDVTARSQAEDLLLDKEHLFRSTMDASPIGMCLIAADGTFLHVNQALCDFLGRDADTLRASTWQELTHPDDLAGDLQLVEAVLAGERDTYRISKRYLRPDGSVLWGDLVVRGIRDGVGEVTHFISQIVDVTAHIEAERALEKSQARFRLLAENASDLVFRCNDRHEVDWVSPSVEQVLGWQPADVLGKRGMELLHPSDVLVAREAAQQTGNVATFRARMRCRNGSWKWMAIRTRPVRDENDTVVGQVGSGRDIDAEHRAQRELAAEHNYLRLVIETELDARVLVGPVRDATGEIVDLRYLDVNPRALASMGLPESDVLGKGMLELFPTAATSGMFDMYVDTLQSGEPLIADEVAMGMDPGGALQWLDLRAVRVQDTLSIVWRDVSERRQMQAALERSEQRFRLMAMNTSDIVRLVSPDGTMQWVSPSLTRSLGWECDQWLGRRLSEFVHPDDVAVASLGRHEVLGGSERTVRIRIRDAAGQYHWTESRGAPFRNESGQVEGMMAAMTIIDERVASEEALRHQASHDPLTGLLTRDEAYRQLLAILDHPPRTGTLTFVAFADLDNLKAINDEFGHAAGDELLRVVSRRIQALLRDGDLIARVGGDELLLVLPGMQHEAAAVALMGRLLATVNSEHALGDRTLTPRLSIGVAQVHGVSDIEHAISRADAAMYDAKAQGGNQVRVAS